LEIGLFCIAVAVILHTVILDGFASVLVIEKARLEEAISGMGKTPDAKNAA
jgi:hypothetical protein